MKLLISGSRTVEKFDLSPFIPCDCELIITGKANGVDTIAKEYADTHSIPCEIVPPNYEKHSGEKMVGMADAVLAVWDGNSAGTKYTMGFAVKYRKPLAVIPSAAE